MKKEYENPQLDLDTILFNDVVCASGAFNPGGYTNDIEVNWDNI